MTPDEQNQDDWAAYSRLVMHRLDRTDELLERMGEHIQKLTSAIERQEATAREVAELEKRVNKNSARISKVENERAAEKAVAKYRAKLQTTAAGAAGAILTLLVKFLFGI